MPVFVYEDYMYDREDPDEGLFRIFILVCVSHTILFITHPRRGTTTNFRYESLVNILYSRYEGSQMNRPVPAP